MTHTDDAQVTAGGAPTQGGDAGDVASEAESEDDNDDRVPVTDDEGSDGVEPSSNYPHCNFNFVANTVYQLTMGGEGEEIWGEAQFDPQPRVPPSHQADYGAGDFVLVRGEDIKLNRKGKGGQGKDLIFDNQDQFVLTDDWDNFEEDMSTADLRALGDKSFLLWWQNVKQPKAKAPKPKAKAIIPKKKKAGAKKK